MVTNGLSSDELDPLSSSTFVMSGGSRLRASQSEITIGVSGTRIQSPIQKLDDTPEARLKDAVTSPYDVEDSDLGSLLVAISNQFDDFESARQDVHNAKFIDSATGKQLEKLASIVPALRKRDESVSEFRQRTKAQIRSQLSSGTHDDILELTAVLLGIEDSSIINIEEQKRSPNPSFSVNLPVDTVGNRGLNTASLDPLLDEVSAAGVRPTSRLITPEATFSIDVENTQISDLTHRSDPFASPLFEKTETELLNNNGLSSGLLEPLSYSPGGFDLSGGPGSSAQVIVDVEDTAVSTPKTSSQFIPTVTASKTQNTTRSAKGLSSSELETLSQTGWSMSNT